ncbi:hydantoinase/oxoprolinase N-terminal domain-containing protein, partial [Staphylococcus aureus]
MPQFIAADTGGTFTDVTIYDTTTGRLSFGKTLTTYGHLVDGVIGGIREAGGSIAQSEWLR